MTSSFAAHSVSSVRGVVAELCHGGIFLHGCDAVLARGFRGIHLAHPDDLPVGRLEHKVRFGALGALALKACFVRCMLPYRLDAVQSALLALVALADKDYLSVRRLQIEAVLLAIGPVFQVVRCCHRRLLSSARARHTTLQAAVKRSAVAL